MKGGKGLVQVHPVERKGEKDSAKERERARERASGRERDSERERANPSRELFLQIF